MQCQMQHLFNLWSEKIFALCLSEILGFTMTFCFLYLLYVHYDFS